MRAYQISSVSYGTYGSYQLDRRDGDTLAESHGGQLYRSHIGLEQRPCFSRIINSGQSAESKIVDVLKESGFAQSRSYLSKRRVA